jgi:hypothetical protein
VTPDPLPQALAVLEQLLDRQAQALRVGDVDEVQATTQAMRQAFAVIARLPAHRLAAGQRPRLESLAAKAEAATTVLARRAARVEQSLEALGAASRLQAHRQQATYAADGRIATGPVLRGGHARA